MSENVGITNGQLFEFMTKMYSEMQEGFKQVNSKVDSMENEVKKTNTKIDKKVEKQDVEIRVIKGVK